MNPAFNPDSWMDIAAYGLVALPATIAAAVAVRQSRQNKSGIDATLDQVRNSHNTNLRDDIDEIARELRAGFNEVRTDLRGIRDELRQERVERIEGDRRRFE